jgi:hypothetical protein
MTPPPPPLVGNGWEKDWVAQLPSGTTIASAEGYFSSVTGLVDETDSVTTTHNTYSLQLNTNEFPAPVGPNNVALCSGSQNPACQGLEQFVYDNSPNNSLSPYPSQVYVAYWLVNYGPEYGGNPWTCPAPFKQYGTTINCWTWSTQQTVPYQAQLGNLAQLSVFGSVVTNGDQAIVSIGSGALYTSYGDDLLLAPQRWTAAEFNVFGLGSGSQANFTGDPTLVGEIATQNPNGTLVAPACSQGNFTQETNNLNLTLGACCTVGAAASVLYTETGTQRNPPPCATLTPEDKYYREKTCSLTSSSGQLAVGVLRNGSVYVGTGFAPGSGNDTVTSWIPLPLGGASVPKSHPATAYVLDSSGNNNLVVLYTGSDNKVYESHQVTAAPSFSPFSAATYAIPSTAGWNAQSAVAVAGGMNVNDSFGSTNMLIAVLDGNHKVHVMLSNGTQALSGWLTPASKTLFGAPAVYSDPFGAFYVVGVDKNYLKPYQVSFSPSTLKFGAWTREAGTTNFGTGVAASFSADSRGVYYNTVDYNVTLAGNAADQLTPWSDVLDTPYGGTQTSTASALPGPVDSAPSAGETTGCSAGGCSTDGVLSVHDVDGNCYWRYASDSTSPWSLIGHP